MTSDISGKGGDRSLSPDYDRVSPNEARRRQRSLGAGLRDAFESVIHEPVPDEFRAILARADAGQGRR